MVTPADFGIDPRLVPLNHASFGVVHREMATLVNTIRARLEGDSATSLGSTLTGELAAQARAVQTALNLAGGELALCANTTEAANALASSWPLQPGDEVAMLAGEYSSVIAAWQHFAAQRGAHVNVLPLPLPATKREILTQFAHLSASTRVIVLSALTSSSALRLPVAEISALANRRNIALLVDAAHVVGHSEASLHATGATAVFGSLHKWLPIARPAGFLWLADFAPHIHPAMVSLGWESADLTTRFSWRGTWDPAPLLCVQAGLDLVARWRAAGLVQRARMLADEFSRELVQLGCTPTADRSMQAAQLRGFIVPTTDPQGLYQALHGAGVRVWGRVEGGVALLRIATHVYSHPAHGEALIAQVRRFL